MKPYYDQDGITIYNADCHDVLPTLEPVGLIWTDVPYSLEETGIDFSDAYQNFMVERFGLMKGILEDRSMVVVCCSPPQVFMYRDILETAGFTYKGLHAWMSRASFYPSSFWNPSWESLIVVSLGKLKILHKEGGHADVNFNDCSVFTRPKGQEHPATKPQGLVSKYIIGTEAQTILDPFMGSGTTLRAAKDLGRKAIGIEIEERYCEIAANRLAQGVLL